MGLIARKSGIGERLPAGAEPCRSGTGRELTRRAIRTAAATEFDPVEYEAAALNAILRRSGTTDGAHAVGPDFAGLPERVAETWRVLLAGIAREGALRLSPADHEARITFSNIDRFV